MIGVILNQMHLKGHDVREGLLADVARVLLLLLLLLLMHIADVIRHFLLLFLQLQLLQLLVSVAVGQMTPQRLGALKSLWAKRTRLNRRRRCRW